MNSSLSRLRRIVKDHVELLLRESFDEDEDEDEELIQQSVEFGKLAKKLFKKYKGPSKFSSSVKVHWVRDTASALKFLNSQISGEVSANVYPAGTDVKNLESTWGDVGLQLEGTVTLYSELDMYTGSEQVYQVAGEKFPLLDEFFFEFPDNFDDFFDPRASVKVKLDIMKSMGFPVDPPSKVLSHNEALIVSPVVVAIYIPVDKKEAYSKLISQAKKNSIPVLYKKKNT